MAGDLAFDDEDEDESKVSRTGLRGERQFASSVRRLHMEFLGGFETL